MNNLEMLGIVLMLLLVATLLLVGVKKWKPHLELVELDIRLKLWWGMITVFGCASLIDPVISLLSLMFLSMMCLREYFSLIKMKKGDRRILLWAYLSVPIQFYWVYDGWYGMFIIFIPVYVFLLMPFPKVFSGITSGFLRNISAIQWGMMLMVFGLSHLAFFPKAFGEQGSMLVLFLVVATQLSDVVQYIATRCIGKHLVIPTADRYKSWEGFFASLIVVSIASCIIAPVVTPMDYYYGFLAGIIISMAGFFGSSVIAMVKRDMSLSADKEEDIVYAPEKTYIGKIDSISFTVPLFFHYIYYLYY